jgi:DMSO/TMAO reductase YedYZ molybdopterin-dependent catalytic subunit
LQSQNTQSAGRVSRRRFLKSSSVIALAAAAGSRLRGEDVELPFQHGERPLVQYPQKRPLIRLTARPPQLETPFAMFNESIVTPNDAFFVRYHLTNSPPNAEQLENFKLSIKGLVKEPLTLTVEDLRKNFEPVEVMAVNQCSGNSRGFSMPRVPGGQSANGMMGNASWKGVPLKAVLEKAGVQSGARQATFNGMDSPLLPQTPDFIKALDIDQALDGEVMLAYEMNGEPIPWLNGFPLRLVVPGYFGTYWVKHLNEIQVVGEEFNGWWMNPGYRIPANACGCVEPGTKPSKTVPIGRFNVRSFLTSHLDGSELKAGQEVRLRGFAFDGGYGITQVILSEDGGRSWKEAALGKDLGRYSFREWTLPFTPKKEGALELKVRAFNRTGQSQPMEPLWNPAGYMRNVVETTKLKVV